MKIDKIKSIALMDSLTKEFIPVQYTTNSTGIVEVSWITPWIQKERIYELLVNEEECHNFINFEVKKDENRGTLEVYFDKKHLLTYHYGSDIRKPYIYPLKTPFGVEVTECSPRDHIHHKSLWVAHGDVNGNDLWSEKEDSGKILHEKFIKIEKGPVFTEICSKNIWVSSKGQPLLDEIRMIKIWRPYNDEYYIDFKVRLIANYEDVVLGDTKEAGTISLRVAPTMTVKSGYGRILNSWGGINEKETWGKRAEWCDYSGIVNGIRLGITIFDHPDNPRFPTYWHVRDYGLMTANIFGLTYFKKTNKKRGDLILKKGESIDFYYRVYIHRGFGELQRLANKYIDFIYPLEVKFD